MALKQLLELGVVDYDAAGATATPELPVDDTDGERLCWKILFSQFQ